MINKEKYNCQYNRKKTIIIVVNLKKSLANALLSPKH